LPKKGGKMTGDSVPTSASLALWAEDNDIAPEDLAKAYNISPTATVLPLSASAEADPSKAEAGRYIAIDCEMVGVGGKDNERSALARVSIVNYHGNVLLDTFVKPKEKVTDWRTWVSGVKPSNMEDGIASVSLSFRLYLFG
jgi:RNA exonuclease 4